MPYSSQDAAALWRHVKCVEDTQALRDALPSLNLVAFVGDGSILPRASGASDAPMPTAQAVAFRAPDSLAVEVQLPHAGRVRGLGVKKGITLIVGGGFHGKSTLLEAIEAGVYNKVNGRAVEGRDGLFLLIVSVRWSSCCTLWQVHMAVPWLHMRCSDLHAPCMSGP